ncbi:MAG: DNA repair protein RecN [Sporomusaceae bacterium]|nr:DNA repair protein RecN [Sporomusaceae bacterium]
MLKLLTVSNFALIDHIQIAFAPGLNILTGETGAGKSILIDALGAILGERASTDLIRRDCDYFRIEAVIAIAGSGALLQLLDAQGIPCEEAELIISRRLTRSGKNTITVNGCQIPLAVLRQFGELLLDMHGQHENQALLRPQAHLLLLDDYAATAVKPVLTEYGSVYQQWQQSRAELADYELRCRERERRIEMLSWQTEEIQQAQLQPGEDEQCRQEIRLLANAEKIAQSVSRSYLLLQQGERGGAVLPLLGEIRRELDAVVRYDESLQAHAEVATECFYQLEDIASQLRHYADGMDSDPARLQQLEDRMAVMQNLKKKYGATLAEVLAYQQEAAAELEGLQRSGQTAEQLAADCRQLEERLSQLGQQLNQERRRTAALLEAAVTEQLRDLGMPNAIFNVAVSTVDKFLPTGCNEVVCLFSANRGEAAKPLQKVASGGELSRIALAIKSVSAYRDAVGTVIFDEVDAGIGGKTAQMVAEKIAFVASGKQVLCITHSAAIASMADSHFLVEKTVDAERTITLVRPLAPPEQMLELARMIAGDDTQIAVENARQMIDSATKKKAKWINAVKS